MEKVAIEEISTERALEIVSTLRPKGVFYTVSDGLYVGIDNKGSKALVEKFETLEACKKWLCKEEVGNQEQTKQKRLIDYIGERHGVNYANVLDYLKDLQYNPPEKNVEELIHTLLYVEANEILR